MNNWWSRLSLKNKLQLPIQLLLLAIMILAQRSALNTFEAHVLEGSRQKVEVSADGVLNGLNMLMVTGAISDSDNREMFTKKMSASDGVLELRVMRGKPVQDQFGPGLPAEQPVDELDKRALTTGQPQTELLSRDGVRALRVVMPFIAREEFRGTQCLTCHMVPAGSVNGAASITVDLTAEYALMSKANAILWGVQLAVQLFLYFAIGWLIDRVVSPTRELQKVMQSMQADGDLTKRACVRNQDEIGKTAQAFNDLTSGFHSIVTQVGGHAGRVEEAAHSLAKDAGELAQGAQRQSDTAASTSVAVEQVSAGIARVAEGAERVSKLSCESLERANRGQESLHEMVRELERVEGAVGQISISVGQFVSSTQSITSMTQQVKAIAEQTNLLALNAAIEAARAGEQGRGFAVVADEVRKLAEKSAQSANEIDEVTQSLGAQSDQVEKAMQQGKDALQSSQKHVREVTEVLVAANVTVGEVNRGLEEISESINQQRDASQEIAHNVDAIAVMASRSNEVVRRTVEEVQVMEQLSEKLRQTVGRFKI